MLGTASVAVMAKIPCSQVIAPLEEVPVVPAVRSKMFANALRFWPKWASELDPSQPHFFPAYRLDVHNNPNFVALPPRQRFDLVEFHLLKREKIIEQGLAELPERIARRLKMPIEKVRNLTKLFIDGDMITNSSTYLWLTYHRDFYLTAAEELALIEPNFTVMHRLAVDRFASMRLNLEDGFFEEYRITARVMELSGDWKTVRQVSDAIYKHWWSHIFPGYNRYPTLSNMKRSRAGLESLNRFLANDLPKLDLSQIKVPLKFVPDPENPGYGKVPALDGFPVRQSIAMIKAEARLRMLAENLIQSEIDELKELIEAPVRPDITLIEDQSQHQ